MKIVKADKSEIGTSVIGALIVGMGLGALFYNYLTSYIYLIIVMGIILHGVGMYLIHKREKINSNEQYSISNIMYWICWVILASLAIYITWSII